MTVYNITKLSPGTAKAVAQYLGVGKVTLTYSEWLNKFGVKSKVKSEATSVPVSKRLIVDRYLNTKFGRTPLTELMSCPKIERSKK